MTRLTDEDIAQDFMRQNGWEEGKNLPSFEAFIKLLTMYPEYHTHKRFMHTLENSAEIRQRLIDIVAKMDLPINENK